MKNEKRTQKLIIGFGAVIILLAIILVLFYQLKSKSGDKTIDYKEEYSTPYTVNLRESEYFNEEVTQGKYIASLIEGVDTTFNYNIIPDKDTDFSYEYRIVTDVKIRENTATNDILYSKKSTLVDTKTINGSKGIKEDISIDYNEYNRMIEQLIFAYGLENVDSTLEISLYVKVIGDDIKEKGESVVTLSLPLTTKTVSVDISTNIAEATLEKTQVEKDQTALKVIIILLCCLELVIVYFNIKYIYDTQSAKKLYLSKVNKIMNNYDSYIQKVVNNEIELPKKSDVVEYKMEKFEDLLEIRDNLNSPILMFQDEVNMITEYKILDMNNNAVYTYTISVRNL